MCLALISQHLLKKRSIQAVLKQLPATAILYQWTLEAFSPGNFSSLHLVTILFNSTFLDFKKNYFMCLPACTCVPHACSAQICQKGVSDPLELGCQPSCGHQEPKPGPPRPDSFTFFSSALPPNGPASSSKQLGTKPMEDSSYASHS